MARQIITRLVDDLDGGEATQTVEFALDGITYTVDLSDKNASTLRDVMAPYVAVGARQGGRRAPAGGKPARATRGDLGAVREWAKASGYEVSDRGRIPAHVLAAYEAGKPRG